LALESSVIESNNEVVQVNIIGLTDIVRSHCQVLAQELRNNGYSVSTDLLRRSLKPLMREANRNNAILTILIGEDELKNNTAQVKNMKTGEQTAIMKNKLIDFLAGLDF
jgi:histidyl-tRNA synthetase